MPRIVIKFGGTSVGSIELIEKAAQKVAALYHQGHEVLVVVSAMAGVTNELIAKAHAITPRYNLVEYDSIISAGEQISSGLLAIALEKIGVPARSWQGWQIPLRVSSVHKNAEIKHIDTQAVLERFAHDRAVAVVSGFQGITKEDRIATLGRSGSDTSAVALACALEASECIIYTDVDGIYTADPRVVDGAQALDKISYEEMLELSYLGAKVIHNRAVSIAMAYNLPLWVRSSFSDKPGTLITAGGKDMEGEIVHGVTCSLEEAKIVLSGIDDKPGKVAAVFGSLAKAGINVDMIVQNATQKNTTEVTFTIPQSDAVHCEEILRRMQDTLGFDAMIIDTNVSKISVVGIGMRSHSGVAAIAFETLAELNINIQAIATSEIKITVLIDRKFSELAVRSLHSRYDLDKFHE